MNAGVIGKRLRDLRGDRSQAVVAEAIGVTAMAISQYEQGERIPRDEIKMKLADYYGVDIKDLFFTFDKV